MATTPLRGLAYLRAASPDLDAWSTVATEVLGMEAEHLGADRLRLRVDDRVGRVFIQRGDEPGVQSVGWEVANEADLDLLRATFDKEGVEYRNLDVSEAQERCVSGGLACTDPAGVAAEFVWGAYVDPIRRFISPLGVNFITGDQGLGHITVLTDRYEDAVAFYRGVLGFEMRETVGAEFDIAFLGCNVRQHAIAIARAPQGVEGTHFDHLMVEVDDIDHVGRALDKVLDGAAALSATLGRHWNDEMISFYIFTPSAFRLEYGFGGKRIEHSGEVELTQRTPGGGSRWGHEMLAPPGS